jgi:propionate CoA-transferase
VSQGAPEALLEGLGNRFRETGTPRDLTVLFGGGPGDWATKGLNHLGQEGMIRRAIGSHYGQTPMIAELVLANKIEGYAFPMGAISRMFHQVSRH